uniref:Secreted protein n=1 Tax=Panstrongylus lignarius TaxID=156445 RepID=A0A224XUI4_9HEMI
MRSSAMYLGLNFLFPFPALLISGRCSDDWMFLLSCDLKFSLNSRKISTAAAGCGSRSAPTASLARSIAGNVVKLSPPVEDDDFAYCSFVVISKMLFTSTVP